MIGFNDVFNDESLAIFTDASMTTLRTGESVGCSGSCTVFGPNSYDLNFQINRNSTNNNSEIKALRLGVLEALKYRNNYKYIRIFSDSQISIFGIRDRIFNWQTKDNKFIGYSGDDIKNQEIFIEIVNIILDNNLRVEFYHQKGHVKNSRSSLAEATKVFQASNNIRDEVNINLIKSLTMYNNIVDEESRKILFNTNLNSSSTNYKEPVSFFGTEFSKSNYFNLIHS